MYPPYFKGITPALTHSKGVGLTILLALPYLLQMFTMKKKHNERYKQLEHDIRANEMSISFLKQDRKDFQKITEVLGKALENFDQRIQYMEDYLQHIGLSLVREGKVSFITHGVRTAVISNQLSRRGAG